MAIPLRPIVKPEEFTKLNDREQRVAGFVLSHAIHDRLLDLYETILAANVAADGQAKASDRNTAALEIVAEILRGSTALRSGLVDKGDAASAVAAAAAIARPPSVPPKMRPRLPSLLEENDNDSPTQVGVKTVARSEIERREEAIGAMIDELAAARVNTRRLRAAALVLGLVATAAAAFAVLRPLWH